MADNVVLEQVNEIVYLGCAFSGDGRYTADVERRVLPFFKKSERNLNIQGLDRKYHSVDGKQSVQTFPYIDIPSVSITESFNEGGLPITDFNGFQQLGTMQAQATSKGGQRVSTNTAFIDPIRDKRKNLIVKPNSEVVKILINENKEAYGVLYINHGHILTAHARKEVIVSGGTINSPKLLMLSGIGPRKHLESLGIPVVKDLAVGRNLHDHVTFNGILIGLTNATSTTVDNQELLRYVYNFSQMKIKEGPLSGNGPVNSVSFLESLPNLDAPDIQYQCDEVPSWRQYVRDPVSYKKVAIFPTAFYDGIIPRTENLVPYSRGYILLNSSNIYEKPLIYANYFDDERDLLPILRGVKFLLSLENTKAFRASGLFFVKKPLPACKKYEWGNDDYITCLARSYTSSPYHPVGTCKMGPKADKTAVVDNELRVYGVKHLRVIDASIMPKVPRGNTNAPSIMVGERGVDFIVRDWTRY